ncbi:MAG TPA: hypothetical protein PKM84_00100 [Candidatus Pacearchaeota archaeon]|nr:hypothetical protein [Candidatus Pacearchaeota archaeon]
MQIFQTENLVILTRKPKEGFLDLIYFWQSLKLLTKKILGRNRGPEAVANSLKIGFKDLKKNVIWDPQSIPCGSIVGVLSGVKTLQYAIKEKRAGRIKRIIAGPNIVISPSDFNNLLLDPLIDKIVVPSQWVADYYSTFDPCVAQKIVIWPAGVTIPEQPSARLGNKYLVFKKNVAEELYQKVINYLREHKVSYEVIAYGQYKQADYWRKLETASALIYLQASESQGLALMEAWAYDVPTLVWNQGLYHNQQTEIKITGKVSAPYLSEEAGLAFSDFSDFQEKFPVFHNRLHQFRPHEYCLKNFTHQEAARKYLGFTAD